MRSLKFSIRLSFFSVMFIIFACTEPNVSQPNTSKVEEDKGIVVYSKLSHIQFWDTLPDGKSSVWPGEKMLTTEKGWNVFKISGQISSNIIFSNNGDSKTENLSRNKNGWYYIDKWYDEEPSVDIESIQLKTKVTYIKIGESESLISTYYPETAIDNNISWSSDDLSIATVNDNGLVTGVSEGTVKIIAKSISGVEVYCTVNIVSSDILIEEITLNETLLNLLPGMKTQLLFDLKPFTATNRHFTWESSNNQIVTVTSDGYLNALSNGNAVITLIWDVNPAIKAQCNVNVSDVLTYNYSDENPFIKVEFGEGQKTHYKIKNVIGRSLYLVKGNRSRSNVVSGSLSGGSYNNNNGSLKSLSSINRSYIPESNNLNTDYKPATDFNSHPKIKKTLTRSGVELKNESDTKLNSSNYTVDITERKFWVDDSNDNFIQINAHLRDIGTYCYVWVADDNYGTANNKVNNYKVSGLSDAFDKIRPLITNVYGYEKGGEPGGSGGVDNDMRINILIYDINFDYSEYQNGGTFGYYWAKDEFPQEKIDSNTIKTNNCELFYIDANFTNLYFGKMKLTLSHEYQHMINFNKKYFENDLDSETWYTEMLSMLSEDMISNKLFSYNDDSPIERIHYFNSSYYKSGLNDWLDDDVYASYASSYAFGAYLVRNYGGARLVEKISKNNKVNFESITDALYEMGYKDETFETVFEKFAQSLVFEKGRYTKSFNESTTSNINGEYYDFNAFNIWGITQREDSDCKGPVVFSNSMPVDLRPLGYSIHSQASWNNISNDLDVYITKPNSKDVFMYLMIK